MRIGYLQFQPRFGQPRDNLRLIEDALAEVEADLLVLPELALTGYHFADRAELAALAEDPDDSPSLAGLAALSAARRTHLVVGFAERRGDRIYNSALLVGPGGLLHVYRKLHLFNRETLYFDRGDLPLAVQEVHGMRIGMMVCFDWAFPEVARRLSLDGAQVLCQPANLVLGFCQQAMVTRCIENGVYAVTANRIGSDERPHGRLGFTGASQVVDPRGAVLVRAPADQPALDVVSIEPAAADDKAITPRNHLFADRRPDCY